MKHPFQRTILEQHTPNVIIEQLLPYVNVQRQARIDAVIDHRLNGIQLAIECPADINNVFAAMRTAEALGVGQVHIITPEGTARSAPVVSRGASFWLDVYFHNNLSAFSQVTHAQSLTVFGGMPQAPLPVTDIPVSQPLCLLLGNEQRGLTPAAQAVCHEHYTIPMVGMSESMNLSVSAAISLYDTTLRKRQQLERNTDLTIDQRQRLKAQFLLNSVAPRLAKGLFGIK